MVKGIILIVIETFRWDPVSCYGYPRGTTPSLDALAQEGVIFEHAISAASRTWQSCTSLLTGLYPRHHGVYIGDKPLSPEIPTLPERLKEAGCMTFGRTVHLGRAGLWDDHERDATEAVRNRQTQFTPFEHPRGDTH